MPRQGSDGLRIDLDLEHARREAERVRDMLRALRRRHDLSRYEYTRVVRIVPGSDTFSHPILTLGNRFADNEDLLLSTYLHEQMHWYLWHLGTPDKDPVAPFFDELVRRYPEAPTDLPDGGLRVALRVASGAWLRHLLLRVAPYVRAVEPVSAMADAGEAARAALARYESPARG